MTNQNQEGKPAPEERVIYVPAYPGGMPDASDDEIDLLELWNILWRGKWFIIGFTLFCTLIAVYWTLYQMPVTYRSQAVLLPTEQSSGMGRLSGLAGILPIDLPSSGGKTVNIINFLQSRDIQQRLLEKYQLLPHYHPDSWDEEQQRWLVDDPAEAPSINKAVQRGLISGVFDISQTRDTGLISLSWVDRDPEFTALMLGRVIDELRHFLDHEYETDAKREREFIEGQLASATQELEYWEQQVPRQDLTMAKIQRERAASQTVYSELRKQLELAKISEAKEVARFKVLDAAYVPEFRYKPNRTMICAVTIVASGMLAVFLVFGHHAVRSMRRRQEQGTLGER